MIGVLIVAIIFGTVLAIVVIVFAFVLLKAKIQTGGSFRGGEQLQANETRLIQELHQGLSRMEERIEALETIMLDREEKEERKEDTK